MKNTKDGDNEMLNPTKLTQLLLLLLAGFAFISCASNAKYIKDKDSAKYTSYGIDYHDIEKMVDNNAKSLLKSDFIKDLTLKSQDKKVLAISDIQNDTNENIDMELLSRKFVRKIRDSKKFILTNAISGNANSIDSMIRDSRELRNDEEFNQHTTQQKGNLISPNYSLSGKISQRVTRIRNDIRIDYQFLLTLTDLKTGTVVWDNEEVIFKLIAQEEIEEQLAEQNKMTTHYPSYSTTTKKTPNKRRSTSKNHFIFGLDMSVINVGQYSAESSGCNWGWGGGCSFSGAGAGHNNESVWHLMWPASLLVGYERDISQNWALGVSVVYTHIFAPSIESQSPPPDPNYWFGGMATQTDELHSHRMGVEIVGSYKFQSYELQGGETFVGLRVSKDWLESSIVSSFSYSGQPIGTTQAKVIQNSYLSIKWGFAAYTDSRRVGLSVEINYDTVIGPYYTGDYMMSGFGTALGLRIRI